MKTRRQQTDSFKVQTASGKTYEVAEYTEQTYEEYMSPSANKWSDGMKEYKVSIGGNANKKSETDFEIVLTGELAVRI